MNRRFRITQRGRNQRSARLLFTGLAFVQILCVLVFLSESGPAPPRGGLIEALWARGRPALIMATAVLLMVGPLLSTLLWFGGLRRRLMMLSMWAVFVLAIGIANVEKMQAVGRVLWRHRIEPMISR